jgi:hypothetical protein
MGVRISLYKWIVCEKVRIEAISKDIPMGSENTLYHVMSLRGAR